MHYHALTSKHRGGIIPSCLQLTSVPLARHLASLPLDLTTSTKDALAQVSFGVLPFSEQLPLWFLH
jgi:hypothetical protein